EQEISSKKNQIKDMKLLIQQLETYLKQELFKSNLADSRQREDEAKRLLNSSHSLIKIKDNGLIKGLYDLCNLGVIDDKYDVAISIACSALNNIVVDSIEVGQTCIEYLKRKELGCAKFILLNELPTMDMSPIQTP
ncbi:2657_t:CDS:2, partial [Funneliformis caledonium]